MYITNDEPSPEISILDDDFNLIRTLKTEQEISRRDSIIQALAWSEVEQKVACILGNYSISLWSKDDDFKYEVNVPLPADYLANPYVKI